ncbi:MAG: tRNA lysidine(34) synthetase TilS, partial [Treponema sp.]|nr:tRNA lysidine(34) synthetase TilS [Candidatus Treponema equifaecale]
MTMNFEEKVLQGLLKCGVSAESVSIKTPLGVAVSGGADSVSLLLALSRIFSPDFIKVITVNHGIREKSQTDGDAAFVKDFCKKLGIFCKEKVFEQGQIQKIAEARRKGIEEAARFKRYEAFEDFIKEENLVGLCLAHHQGDVLETVLMRFFNGSGAEGLSGIASRREKYLRPLLEINRQEIESYLVQNNISWCTDSTNSQNDYARNKIRNLLVPFLNENFPQWQEGLVSASEKFQADKLFFEAVVSQKLQKLVKEQTETEIVLDLDKFCSLDFALK